MREVAWVVFDEIHYMRDAGVLQNPDGTDTPQTGRLVRFPSKCSNFFERIL